MSVLGKLVALLPDRYRVPLLRARHASRIRGGTFVSTEPDFAILDAMVGPGDWAIDIGANIGVYTVRLSEIVGETGRVFSFEPVPATFETLTANVSHLRHRNVTLINAGVSDRAGEAVINIPISSSRRAAVLDGWASLEQHNVPGARDEQQQLGVYAMPLDSLTFTRPIRLIKLDVEGHDVPALKGMTRTIKEHQPTIIVEAWTEEVLDFLASAGYACEKLLESSNYIARPAAS